MPSWESDIKQLFRQKDIDHMNDPNQVGPSGVIDLSSYDDVKAHADDILQSVTGETILMPPPPDAPWTPDMINTFQAWKNAGFPEFDAVPQSGFIVTNQDTFSTDAVTALGGTPAVFSNVFYLILDGFAAKDLGATTSDPRPLNPPTAPTFTFAGAGAGNMKEVNPLANYEVPGTDIDVPQRITIAYDLKFNNTSDFPTVLGQAKTINMQVSLATVTANAILTLVKQANPYMHDVDANLRNPYWLSFDTRVFQVTEDGSILGVPFQGHDQFTFLQDVLTSLRNTQSKFETLSADEDASVLELSQKVSGKNVFNYAVARVRYLAPAQTPATDVQVFFRVFSTLVSALDYDSTSSGAVSGNYRRTGNTSGSMPLLGIQKDQSGNGEVASFPCFAEARNPDMSAQTDGNNIRTINGGGTTEQVEFFGCWLDINQTNALFPRDPLADTQGPNGPFTGSGGGPLQSIQQLITGHHQCLVAEIFFWPSGTMSDPIHSQATPASSDRLAQRNLSIVPSGNPGWPDAHTIQHTFTVKPSAIPAREPTGMVTPRSAAPRTSAKGVKQAPKVQNAAAQNAPQLVGMAGEVSQIHYRGPDELIIRWNNVPRDSTATIYLPEIEVDEILALSALRQHPGG
jgi:hypothetical protein